MPIIPQLCSACGGGGGSATDKIVNDLVLCDVDPATGEVVGAAIAVYTYDEATGNPSGPPTFVVPGTNNPYVVQFGLRPCDEADQDAFQLLCDVQTDGSSVQFIRHYIFNPLGGVASFHDAVLTGGPYTPTGTVSTCEPDTTCTPDSNLDLNANCGPGETPNETIIRTDHTHPLANAVFVDDPAADALCGGSWDNPAAALSAPFPVSESFRNATFDQPGPVLQGSAPYPALTADPAHAGQGSPPIATDPAGAGWLRVSDINSGTNGIWQVPAPFPTAQGATAAITWASHDGTTPGGDGMAFVFTDGSVPPQSIPIGGFGNLGLNNWDGGYVAVVLDEYGQSCTCDHTPHGTISPNPGPCGFCTNTISIQLAGAARQGASCGCCTIAQLPLAPKALNQTTRSQPARVYTSIISEGGQTFVSAGVDWNDGNGIVQYFDRVNVTACAGPPPATLRMASFGGSGGAFRAVKEFRDALARPAGSSHWRAFPITTDPIPTCVQAVNITVAADVTFNSDTQTQGNGDPEAYLWLVNTATNTVVGSAEQTSVPAQVGTVHHLTFTKTVAPADIPNLRVYVGSEARDQAGEYDTLWQNLKITATGTGCPAKKRRTIEISAVCPIPVAIVSGGGSGGGGGQTIVNTPATFEDAIVCATVGGVPQTGFRREVRDADGTITVTFLGQDGLPITPDTWSPGACNSEPDQTLGEVCYVLTASPVLTHRGFLTLDENDNVVLFDGSGNVVPAGTYVTVICPAVTQQGEILCDFGNANHQFLRTYVFSPIVGQNNTEFNFELDGQTVYTPVGPVGLCQPTVTAEVEFDVELEQLCDANGVRFLRRYEYNFQTGVVSSVTDTQLDGTTPFAPVAPVGGCTVAAAVEFDTEVQVLCDANGTRFLRRYVYNESTPGAPTVTDTALDGTTPFAPVAPVGTCGGGVNADFDWTEEILCDDNGSFIRRFRFNSSTGVLDTTTNLTLAGAAYVPVGTVRICAACCPLVVDNVCLSNGHHGVVLRDSAGNLSYIDTTTGAAFNPAADVVVCPSQTFTVNAQSRLVGAGQSWTPGTDVTGSLVSVSFVVVTGTATVTDSNGTAAAGLPVGVSGGWSAEDSQNTLLGPQSITAAAASSVWVTWTQR